MLFFVGRLAGQYLLTGRGRDFFHFCASSRPNRGPTPASFGGRGGKVDDHSPPSRTIFRKLLCWLTPFWLRKISTFPHILDYVNSMSGWQVCKIKYVYFRTDFRQLRLHTGSIRNNALYDLTFIKMMVACFVGTWGMVWCDMIWYDIWYDMIWHDMIWYDMIWYDMLWYDMIWYDMIWYDMIWYDMIYLTAVGLTPGGSSRVHIYTQTIHRTTQSTQTIHRTTHFTN